MLDRDLHFPDTYAMHLAALILEIAILWVISSSVIQTIFTFLMLLFPARSVAVSVISLLLFPGTIVHELSHLFSAGVLGVRAGKLNLVPDNIKSAEVVTGSVGIANTDRVRKTLIGVAPLFTGLILVTAVSYLLSLSVGEAIRAFGAGILFASPSFYMVLGGTYLIFAISNSMMPSHIDLKGSPLVIGSLIVIVSILYVLGLRLSLQGQALELATTVIRALVQSLATVVALNALLLILLKLNIHIMTKILHIRFVKQ